MAYRHIPVLFEHCVQLNITDHFFPRDEIFKRENALFNCSLKSLETDCTYNPTVLILIYLFSCNLFYDDF
jgi:hypothetical protein